MERGPSGRLEFRICFPAWFCCFFFFPLVDSKHLYRESSIMLQVKMEVLTAVAAWAFAAACQSVPHACNYLETLHQRGNADLEALQNSLSSTAHIYYPNTTEFKNATARWSVLEEPQVNVVVVPGTENDVVETVSVHPRPPYRSQGRRSLQHPYR